jgi:hypothetical protein
MANPASSQSAKQRFLDLSISKRAAAVVLIAVVILAAIIILGVPRLKEQLFPEPSSKLTITSQRDWWTNEEVISSVGIVPVYHVKVEVKNLGETAGVCVLHVKVEESGGRFWSRYRFVSVSPGDTVEEQFDFPEVVNENVVYSAWTTST